MNTQVIARQNETVRSIANLRVLGETARRAGQTLVSFANVILTSIEQIRSAQARRFIQQHRHLIEK